MEDEMSRLKTQMEQLMREKQQYEEYINTMNMEKEEMVRTHTLETGDLRKKISVLTDHVQRLESQQSGFGNSFSEMDSMAMDTTWNNIEFLDNFGPMETEVKQELTVVPATKKEDVTIPSDVDKPAAQGGLLFMLFLVGAYVLSSRGSAPQIPRVSEDVRAASSTLLNNIFKEAGVNQAGPAAAVESMIPQPSATSVASSWTSSARTVAPVPGGSDGVAPSVLGDLADSLTQPTEEQNNEQLFGLSVEQYNSMTNPDFLQTPPEQSTSQGRRNLAEALAAMRTNSKQSSAEVYTRSLLFDQIPGDVVRTFAKMVTETRKDEDVHDIDWRWQTLTTHKNTQSRAPQAIYKNE